MGKRTEFLYLSEQDLLKAGVLDSARCVDVLDEMFQLMGQGDYIMGGPRANEHGIRMSFPKEPRFEGMPVTMVEAQAATLPCIKSNTVTDECIVTDLVTSLPIDDPKSWADAILAKKDTPRIDRLADIQRSGYDITAAADKLTRFYLNGESL